MSARADTQWLQLRLTEVQLTRWRKVAHPQPPAGGWIAAVRQAIGMSVAQLEDRLGISRTSLAKMEQREVDGGITLDALRRAADALDCDVVYAIVPRTGSLERVVKSRADLIAGVLVGRAGHSMSLEAQTVEYPDNRPRRDDVCGCRAGEPEERCPPAVRLHAAREPHDRDQRENRTEDHCGKFRHTGESEHGRAQGGSAEARLLEVSPPCGDSREEEKGHDHV